MTLPEQAQAIPKAGHAAPVASGNRQCPNMDYLSFTHCHISYNPITNVVIMAMVGPDERSAKEVDKVA
ncbi:hypothetical protein GCM10025772_18090 [Ferrimonas gelatinilytica]|uniref:Uncharacterized protein n=1 Tax=Ferrimonas gelatinilytica TaxID=1255257 RepID=A0ABP9S6B5_9GAMM